MSDWSSGLVYAVLSITIGSAFHHGFNVGITNMLHQKIIEWIKKIEATRNCRPPEEHYVKLQYSLLILGYVLGGIVGGYFLQFCAKKHGRKVYILWNNLFIGFGVLSSTLSKTTSSYEMLTLGRFIFGIHSGLSWGLGVIYLMEIAPVSIRGAVGSCYQLMLTLGVMTSQVAPVLLDNEEQWHYVFLVPLVPAALQLISLPFCPESPIYLCCIKEDEVKTVEALQWLRGREEVKEELDAIIHYDSLSKEFRLMTNKRFRKDGNLRRLLIICGIVAAGKQFSGVAMIVYHSIDIFTTKMGLTLTEAIHFTIGLTVLKSLIDLITMHLIDVFGRRKMLLISYFGLTLDTVALAVILALQEEHLLTSKYVIMGFYIVFIICFEPGIGLIAPFYTAELFHHTVSFLAMSWIIPVIFMIHIVTVQTFLPLIKALGFHVYLVFAILDVFCLVAVYIYLPETNKKCRTEIIKIYS